MPLPRPSRGGYARGFGAARFILDYLDGQGDKYGVDSINPKVGAPQVEIHYHYKEALRHHAIEQQAQGVEERQARREGRRYNPDNVEALTEQLLQKPLRKLSRMTYASFVVYFRNLKHLGWVEPTGQTEPSAIQDIYTQSGRPAPVDAYPRIFYRITPEGRSAPEDAVSDPLQAIYQYEADQRSSRVPLPSVPRVSEAHTPLPGVVTAAVQRLRGQQPNAGTAQRVLDGLERQGVDVSDAKDALDEYTSIERNDYQRGAEGTEEYRQARKDAWDAFLEALEAAKS